MTVEPILRIDSKLHVVCMIRDPRDAITSTHGKNPDEYWAGLKFWNTYTQFWRRVQTHSRFTTIRYEDFTSDPDGTQRYLMEAIPFLERRVPFSEYHKVAEPSQASEDALGGVRPIRPSSVGRWRNHLSRIAGQLELHGTITEDLIEFGYEDDASWLQLLEDVDPDISSSHHSEYFRRSDIWVRRAMGYIGALIVTARKVGVEPLRFIKWVPRSWIPSQI